MNQQFNNTWLPACAILLAGFYITGCSSSSSDSTPPPAALASYEVKIVNVTNNQPLSPVAVITHSANYSVWNIGSAASTELEYLAEGGSNSELLTSLANEDAASASGAAAIGPGGNETIMVTVSASTQILLSVTSMLVNTNDAFSGLRSIDVSGLAKGHSMTMHAKVYDAGTEINSELQGTIPGPADNGGEGFNAARSDINDIITSHGGVVSADDGLSTSVLDQSHRFDNPAMIVTITRI
jgi:hypothetical protein